MFIAAAVLAIFPTALLALRMARLFSSERLIEEKSCRLVKCVRLL